MTGGGETSDAPVNGGVTPEVGDEGGTPGDVEIEKDIIGGGSEAEETWRPADTTVNEIVRDEKGVGRRTP
jgi:hypothetical protein